MRYVIAFPATHTAATPSFVHFKKLTDLSNVTPPAISEIGSGQYFFEYIPTFDIVFQIDGGAALLNINDRYINGQISPIDGYVDAQISTVKSAVWDEVLTSHSISNSASAILKDTQTQATGTYTRVGAPANASISADIAAVKSDTGATLTQATTAATQSTTAATQSTTAASQSLTASTNTSTILTRVGVPSVSVSADIAAVTSDVGDVTANIASLQADVTLVKKYQEGNWKIFKAGDGANEYRLVIYDTNGVTELMKFDLKDENGNPTVTNPYRRIKVP